MQLGPSHFSCPEEEQTGTSVRRSKEGAQRGEPRKTDSCMVPGPFTMLVKSTPESGKSGRIRMLFR